MWAKVSLFVFVFRLLAKNSAANKSKLPARKGVTIMFKEIILMRSSIGVVAAPTRLTHWSRQ